MSGWVKQIMAIVAAWVSFGGCAAFAPRADPSSFYILAALPEVDLAADKTTAGIKANFSVRPWPHRITRVPRPPTDRHAHFDESLKLFRD